MKHSVITNDITPAVLAIGNPAFPQILLRTLDLLAGVSHCMVFAFAGERSARCLLGVGNIPIAPELGAAYSEHYYLTDPNRDVLLHEQTTATPIVLPAFAPRMNSHAYRRIFFDNSRIVDKFAVAIWRDRTCYYVNFYKTMSRGRFDRQQSERLLQIAPSVSAVVARHLQDGRSLGFDPMSMVEDLFHRDDAFSYLTARERDVCLGILCGLSSEAISAKFGISIHSTVTYRKRAYDKLGISSQNELFRMVLRLVCAVDSTTGKALRGPR
jgi:DNA-binding CsgD family transcriptional regulator